MGVSTSSHRRTATTKTAACTSVNMTPTRDQLDFRRMDSRSYRYFRRLQPVLFYLAVVVVFIGYAFFGAAVFVYLEADTEKTCFEELMEKRRSFLHLVNSSIESSANSDPPSSSDYPLSPTTLTPNLSVNDSRPQIAINMTDIEKELRNYERLVKKYRNIDLDGKPMWNFFGALFLSATVISTIGYGNIAPVTTGGRVFLMIYAVFGIAMLLLVLASIGSLFARGATLTYRLLHMNIQMAKGAPPPAAKKKKRLRAVRVPSPTEEGAEEVPLKDRNTINGSTEQRPSMDEVIRDIWRSNEAEVDQTDVPPMRVVTIKEKPGDKASPTREHRPRDASTTEPSDEDDDDDEMENQVDIPLTIVVLFALMYVCMLAGMLSIWEKQWNYFEAFYFSFITLTTIGFGDLVPQHQKNLLACTFFILLGMAIMSMCIALAQEIIMKKVAWISEKVGVALIKAKPT